MLEYFTLKAGLTKIGTGEKHFGVQKGWGKGSTGEFARGNTHQGYHVNLPST